MSESNCKNHSGGLGVNELYHHPLHDRYEGVHIDINLFCHLVVQFLREVSELVRLHVDAKRYLCATDTDYHAGLSEASQQSLALQGGPFEAGEAAAWAAQPFAEQAALLRSLEDEGKRLWKIGQLTQADLPSRSELLEATRKVLEESQRASIWTVKPSNAV